MQKFHYELYCQHMNLFKKLTWTNTLTSLKSGNFLVDYFVSAWAAKSCSCAAVEERSSDLLNSHSKCHIFISEYIFQNPV